MSRVVVQEAAPSAARLTGSLRDIGYDFQTAVADLVDNCVAAGARHVDVELNYVAGGSYVLVSDDGVGMSSNQLLEALRFGSRRSYRRNELGRFGLGLKTGSFSQCRRLTVVSRHAKHQQRIHTRTLDLDDIERRDAWSVLVDERSDAVDRAVSILRQGPGTVVVWEKLDRVIPEKFAESGWGRRRFRRWLSRHQSTSAWCSIGSSRVCPIVMNSSCRSMGRSYVPGIPLHSRNR